MNLGAAGACLAAVLAIGCDNNRELSPTAPSAIASGGLQSESAGSSSGFTSAARPTTKPEPARPDSGHSGDHAADVELRGTISQLNGVCPAVTFKLDRVQVKTSDKTEFDGARCVDLKDGTAAVKVKGVREGEGVVKASEVEAKRPDEAEAHDVELRGTVADLKGTCPAVTFHVGRPLVTTNDKTEYEGTRCQDLKNGDYVKVSGERTGDHSVLAKSVETERHDSRPSEVKGTISSLTGSCPKVSFKVGNTTVATTDRTQYRGLTCADLATWKKEIEVKGQVQADKTLLAAQITAPKQKGKD
ncbi:MAG: hypothetical protein HYZ58_08490 [Acidobacteria bacterium]|nr:hypothetical protein [Acidobacteriota bacterium]